jgi:hypothetical protein
MAARSGSGGGGVAAAAAAAAAAASVAPAPPPPDDVLLRLSLKAGRRCCAARSSPRSPAAFFCRPACCSARSCLSPGYAGAAPAAWHPRPGPPPPPTHTHLNPLVPMFDPFTFSTRPNRCSTAPRSSCCRLSGPSWSTCWAPPPPCWRATCGRVRLPRRAAAPPSPPSPLPAIPAPFRRTPPIPLPSLRGC